MNFVLAGCNNILLDLKYSIIFWNSMLTLSASAGPMGPDPDSVVSSAKSWENREEAQGRSLM